MIIGCRYFVPLVGLVAALCSAASTAAIYTVGAGGMYDHIQDAIDVAILNAGDDEIRVHTGTYTEGFSVPPTMSSNALTLSGGWGNGYSARVRDGTMLTLIVPPPGTRGGWLRPSGGSLAVSNLHFFDATTSSSGAGLLVMPSNSAGVIVARNIFEGNVVESTSSAGGAAIAVYVQGSGEIDLLDNDIYNNRASIAAGNTGLVYGGAIDMSCSGSTHCVIAGNRISGTEALARSSFVKGGAVRMFVRGSAQAQFDRNRVESVTIGPEAIQTFGRSLYVDTSDLATITAGSNRFHAGWASGGSTPLDETRWDIAGQSSAVFEDSLIAQSPLTAVKFTLGNSATAYLTNLTVADNVSGIQVFSSSNNSAYVSNCLVTNPFVAGNFSGTVFSHDSFALTLPFLAPSLYDYSLRRFDASISDAGNDSPEGGLGYGDVESLNRVVGTHVDIGAWESSDRIFADRLDL